ncbi:thioredoxin-like protein [Chlamydoabsidia padenii]|nr:thioredoxin-like protein [Chlamydoabsidia padenii]
MKLLFVLAILTFVLGCYTQVVEVTDTNFDRLVKKNDQWVIEFYADWCGYCRQFGPLFETSEETVRSSSYRPVYFGKVNIDDNPALAARFFVSRLPTLFHIDNYQVRALPMPRSVAAMVDMVKNNEWETISPIGGWRSPFGIL